MNKKIRGVLMTLGLFFMAAGAFCNSDNAAAKTAKLGSGKIVTTKGSFTVNKNKKAVYITKSGTYNISGNIGSYQLRMEKQSMKVVLYMNNVICANNKTSCIYNTKKSTTVTLKMRKGSVNKFTGPKNFIYETQRRPDAVIFSDGNIKITGTGKLVVKDCSNNGDAIGSKKTISVLNGNIMASSNASVLHSDNICIKGGKLTADAGDTGVKASEKVIMSGGNCKVTAVDKGIQGKSGVTVTGGNIYIKTTHSTNTKFEDFRGITAGVSGSNGKKAKAGSINITGGTININSYGDCIHAANNVTISGGTFRLVSTADDGIQAKANLTITGTTKLSIVAKGKKVKGTTKNIAANITY